MYCPLPLPFRCSPCAGGKGTASPILLPALLLHCWQPETERDRCAVRSEKSSTSPSPVLSESFVRNTGRTVRCKKLITSPSSVLSEPSVRSMGPREGCAVRCKWALEKVGLCVAKHQPIASAIRAICTEHGPQRRLCCMQR